MKRIYGVCCLGMLCFVFLAYSYSPPTVSTGATAKDCKLAVLMYHGFTKGGKESDFVIDAAKFEEDILYLKEKGFCFTDTNDIINYMEGKVSLPQKCVMITIDDGYLNNYTYAFDIIKKHKIKAVISPIAYYSEYYTLHPDKNPVYSHISKNEIIEMHASGLIDFQNHSYNMHSLNQRKGSSKNKDENSTDYVREFYYDLKCAENVIKECTGKKTHAYVYPFGNISSESKSILKCCGYKIGMSCAEGFNYIVPKSTDFVMLKRFNRTYKTKLSQILSQY